MRLLKRIQSIRLAAFVAITATAVAALLADPSHAAAKKSCGGESILTELKQTNPDAYAAIIAEADGAKNGEALLWRISREGIPPSYLFATIHMTDERVTELSDEVRAAITGSNVVALEIADIAQSAMVAVLGKSPALMMFSGDQRLDNLISPEAFKAVEKQLEAARLPAAFANRFKPWVVSMVLAVSNCERKRMEAGNKVLDMRIAELALTKNIPVVGLETIEEQLQASASVPMPEQVAMLRSSLKFADRIDDMRETLLELYLSRRLSAAMPLQKYLARSTGSRDMEFDGFQSKMIDNRNRKMRTHLLPLLADGGVFVAVGGLHLPGENGLVTLLRNAGYTVEPVQ